MQPDRNDSSQKHVETPTQEAPHAAKFSPDAGPLLTLAIPTWNRASYLETLLVTLAPQVAALPEVELLISDNASPDATQDVVASAIAAGLRCRYIRNDTNIEADPNFLQCYREARGTYVWIFGDDDILLPGSLEFIVRLLRHAPAEVVYIRPFGFANDLDERGQRNSAPTVREYSSGESFIRGVGLRGDLVMLSAVVVNKAVIESASHPAFEEGFGTNLLQMGWVFTAILRLQRGLIVERGLFAVCERDIRRGFDIVRTFGPCWAQAARRYLAPKKKLVEAAINDQLYSWFVTNWYAMRRQRDQVIVRDPLGQMLPVYGHKARFWILTWPLLTWPMLLAGGWLFVLRVFRRVHAALDRRFHPALRFDWSQLLSRDG